MVFRLPHGPILRFWGAMNKNRDHGGGLDAAVAHYGGTRGDWIDLSTGINPVPYPVGPVLQGAWTALPDQGAMDRLLTAARRFWNVPDGAGILAANGASALIARMPVLSPGPAVYIPGPTYNEHAAAFRAARHSVTEDVREAPVHVYVHPNNPDGRFWDQTDTQGNALTVIDESFCDIAPDRSLVHLADRDGIVVLKSFGKFWGLAGLRLGFAIAHPDALELLAERLGPWTVSGPALEIGAQALEDDTWADDTRARLAADAERLDALMEPHGGLVGGISLFRLYDVGDAAAFQDRLARAHIHSRIFPYSRRWVRLGLPGPDQWDRLEAAL